MLYNASLFNVVIVYDVIFKFYSASRVIEILFQLNSARPA